MRFPPSGDLSDRFLIVNYLGNRVRDWPAETQLVGLASSETESAERERADLETSGADYPLNRKVGQQRIMPASPNWGMTNEAGINKLLTIGFGGSQDDAD